MLDLTRQAIIQKTETVVQDVLFALETTQLKKNIIENLTKASNNKLQP